MATSEVLLNIENYLETLGANEGYGEELWRLYQANAQAVPEAWRAIFDGLERAPERNGALPPAPGAAPPATAPALP
ncbi:MAG: 2-oxoglutarate dehydrogenase E1 subunit family protein, partial [Terriglobales bacterium]